MSRIVHLAALFAVAPAIAGLGGCEPAGSNSGSPTAESSSASASGDLRNDLWQFGVAYLDHHDVHGAGPPDWETLLAFAAERDHEMDAIQRVRDAGYQVKWGVKIKDVAATGESILSYVIAESPQGGPKLMLDGSVTAE